MTSRPTPRIATWFLNQFGEGGENDAVVGDLVEKYQRGCSGVWFWRQVLSIVWGGLYREVRQNKWWVCRGIAAAVLTHGLLQLEAGRRIRDYYFYGLDLRFTHGSTVYLFPLVTFKVGDGAAGHFAAAGPTVVLNILILLLMGKLLAMSRRIPPETMVRLYIAYFTFWSILFAGLSLISLFFNQPNALPVLIINLLALPAAPVLLLMGSGFCFRKTPAVAPPALK